MTEASAGGASSGDSGSAFVDVGSAEELARRPLQTVTLDRTRIALVHRAGRFSAISGVCNHVGGPLGDGKLDADSLGIAKDIVGSGVCTGFEQANK